MKNSLFYVTLLLTGLISCKEEIQEIPGYNDTRTSFQSDSINSPVISFDLGDTTMTEDIEEIEFNSRE